MKRLILLVFLLALPIATRLLSQKVPPLGVENGRFVACPDKPNCLSSHEGEPPISFNGDIDSHWQLLKEVLLLQPRTRIIAENNDYVRAESASLIFGFIDDLEFLLDRDQKKIHFRSAARWGYYDFGVNRRRIQTIRREFTALSPTLKK